MKSLLEVFGGRKSFVILVAMVLLALKNVIGMTEETATQLLWLALGGAGVIGAEDMVSKLAGGKQNKPPAQP